MNEDLLNVMGSFSEISLDCIEKQNEEIEQLEKENRQLKDRINKAIEYMKSRFMNCIDNDKRYFEDDDIQEIYEILKENEVE